MPKSDENVVRVLRNDGVLDVDELDQFVNRSVVRWDRLDLGEI